MAMITKYRECDSQEFLALNVLSANWYGTADDLWKLCAVLPELFCAIRMFSGAVPPDGHYELRVHLAEIVSLLGPFPQVVTGERESGYRSVHI
jgi:hypothetical protein